MTSDSSDVLISVGKLRCRGSWSVPDRSRGVILFAHGSGSSRLSPRNQYVAGLLQDAGFATLLMDLLDETEADDRAKVFDISLLAQRLSAALDWITAQVATRDLPIGLFGASTGAAAALEVAARRPDIVRAVVSRGGRPDLARRYLPQVSAATLLIVGQLDREVLQLNRAALRLLGENSELRTVPGATHLFEEPGTLAEAADLARAWFVQHLCQSESSEASGFLNREAAGRSLAERLRERRFTDPLVLAIPRGGVVLGAVLAEALHAELDVVLARKLRMPGNEEFALGAISETGDVYLNRDVSTRLQLGMDKECRLQRAEIARRQALFRQGRQPALVAGRSVIVVDDGIATGSTMIAALRTITMQQPLELIVAIPVAAPDRLAQVRRECDEVVCLLEAPDLRAVAEFYEDFTQVEDAEVVALLNRFSSLSRKGRGEPAKDFSWRV